MPGRRLATTTGAGQAAPVVLLVGPPAVGKSTAARALCARFDRSIHVPVDDLRTRVLRGYAPPEPAWPASLVEQVRLARESALDTAQRYAAAGFVVVLDDFVDPPLLREYRALEGRPGVQRAVLAPTRDEARRRCARRELDPHLRQYIEAGIDVAYDVLETAVAPLQQRGYHVLDTSRLTVEATVDRILALPASDDGAGAAAVPPP
jgi:predicted kinase